MNSDLTPSERAYQGARAKIEARKRRMTAPLGSRKNPVPVPERLSVDLTPEVQTALAFVLEVWKGAGVALTRADFIRMAITSKAHELAEMVSTNAGFFPSLRSPNPKDKKQ